MSSSFSFPSSFEVMEDGPYIVLLVFGSVSSVLSIMGSSFVLFMAYRERSKFMHRLMLALSISDLFASTSSLFMPYTIPSFLDLPGAVGNHNSCTASGFFLMTFILVGCTMNAYLSLYFYLVVCRSWRERDFPRGHELIAHAIAFLVPIGVNVAAAVTESINPSPLVNNVCVYATFPWKCSENDDIECYRSSRDTVVDVVFFGSIWLFVFSLMGFLCTFLVWTNVRKTVRRSSMHRFETSQGTTTTRSTNNNNNAGNPTDDRLRQVRTQAILYSLAYFNTAFWPLLAAAFSSHFFQSADEIQENKNKPFFYMLQLFYWALYPLQGFLNFFIYTRLMVRRWRRTEPDRSIFWIYKQILTTRHDNNLSSTHRTGRKSRGASSVPAAQSRDFYNSNTNNNNHASSMMPLPQPEVTADTYHDNDQSAFATTSVVAEED